MDLQGQDEGQYRITYMIVNKPKITLFEKYNARNLTASRISFSRGKSSQECTCGL